MRFDKLNALLGLPDTRVSMRRGLGFLTFPLLIPSPLVRGGKVESTVRTGHHRGIDPSWERGRLARLVRVGL